MLGAEPFDEARDGLDCVSGAARVEHVERVLRARELGVDDRGSRHRTERVDEVTGVLDVGERVVRAVDHEERRGRRRGRGAIGDALSQAARAPTGEHFITSRSRNRRHRGRAALAVASRGSRTRRRRARRPATAVSTSSKPGWYSGSLAVSATSAARCPPAEPPVTTTKSGSAPDLGRVLLHPGERALHVDQMIGERGRRAQAIVGGDADPAAPCQVVHERQRLLILLADRPAAAVDLQRAWGRDRRRRAADTRRDGSGARRVRTRCCGCAPRRACRILNGRAMRRNGIGSIAVVPFGPKCARSASSNTAAAPPARRWNRRSAVHEASVIASPTRPGHASSAPSATKAIVETACHATWCNASSPVSHAPKK